MTPSLTLRKSLKSCRYLVQPISKQNTAWIFEIPKNTITGIFLLLMLGLIFSLISLVGYRRYQHHHHNIRLDTVFTIIIIIWNIYIFIVININSIVMIRENRTQTSTGAFLMAELLSRQEGSGLILTTGFVTGNSTSLCSTDAHMLMYIWMLNQHCW